MREIIACLNDIEKVGKEILNLTRESGIVLLNGDLASGKTTLVKTIARLRGFNQEVTSPTFSLEHIYSNNIFHYDLYRVEFEDLVSLGLIDEFEKDGLHLIEWVDERLKGLLLRAGFDIVQVEITPDNGCRKYKIERLNA